MTIDAIILSPRLGLLFFFLMKIPQLGLGSCPSFVIHKISSIVLCNTHTMLQNLKVIIYFENIYFEVRIVSAFSSQYIMI